MPGNDKDFRIGHRERLRQKFLDGKLADYEKFEALLSYAIPRRDVRPLARGLIEHFGGVYQVFTAPVEELLKYNGVGLNVAVFIKLIQDMTLVNYTAHMKDDPVFHDEQYLTNYCRMLLTGKTVEEFHVFFLDTNYRLIKDWLHSVGTIDNSTVYIRELASHALELKARHVVLLHNHPCSGNSFSTTDIETTINIQKALALLDINLYDHYVVSNGIVYSARNLHLLQ